MCQEDIIYDEIHHFLIKIMFITLKINN